MVAHTCVLRWDTTSGDSKLLHSQYLKRQKQSDCKSQASQGYIGESSLRIKKRNQQTSSPNKINQAPFFPPAVGWTLGSCHGCSFVLWVLLVIEAMQGSAIVAVCFIVIQKMRNVHEGSKEQNFISQPSQGQEYVRTLSQTNDEVKPPIKRERRWWLEASIRLREGSMQGRVQG